MYAYRPLEVERASHGNLTHKSFFVDERVLAHAKKILKLQTEADVVRLSMERVVEMEELWQLLDRSPACSNGPRENGARSR